MNRWQWNCFLWNTVAEKNRTKVANSFSLLHLVAAWGIMFRRNYQWRWAVDTVIQEQQEEKKKVKKKTNKLLIPSIIALGLIPFVVMQFYYNNGLSRFIWYPDDGGDTLDLLIGWKMIATFTIGVLMFCILVYRKIKHHERIGLGNEFYPLVIYGIFVILSGVFSHYKRWAFCGTFEMLEPVGVVLAYLVICFYTYHYIRNESDVHMVLKWAGIGTVILLINGYFQFFGMDFYRTDLFRMLTVTPGNREKFSNNTPRHIVCPPFFNQNNACIYFAMLIPVLLVLIISCKKIKGKICLIIAEILAVICLIGTRSSAGCIAVVIALAISLFIFCCRKKKTLIIGSIFYAAGIAAVILLCVLTPLGKKVSEELLGTPNDRGLYSIDTTGDCIEMGINGQILRLTYEFDEKTENFTLECRDGKGESLETTVSDEEETEYKISNMMYLGTKIAPVKLNDVYGVQVVVEEHEWYFTRKNDGKYYMLNQAGRWERYQSPEFMHIFNDNAFSKRGRIWNGSFKAIMEHSFLIGSGANTFAFVYPQNDYIYRAYNESSNTFDVKAHNIYLQQWIENGIFSLCGFLLFFIGYLLQSVRIYRRADSRDGLSWIGFGIFTGITAYLIAGIANDSNVSTAPVFWALMGVGMAINRILENRNEQEEKEVPEEIPETKQEVNVG